jgi:steroid delta-isomerase-like uncharacterized protein
MATSTSIEGAVDSEFIASFVQRWAAGWNEHDPDALVSLCTEDVVWDDPALPQVIHGRAPVREYLEATWVMFPDLAFAIPEPPLVALDGPRAAQVWRMTGTMLGWEPVSRFAPTGKRVDLEGVDLYEFRDGLLARYRSRYDMALCAYQMGIGPARGSRTERVAAFVQRNAMRLRRRPRA